MARRRQGMGAWGLARGLAVSLVLAALATGVGRAAPAPSPAPAGRAYLEALPPSRAAGAAESSPQGPYAHAIRSAATYLCPYFAADGALREARRPVVAHGTGFAFRRDGGGTLLLTNRHVVEWPSATDADPAVDGVEPGCRRSEERLSLVDGMDDVDQTDDIPLELKVADPRLDLAVARAPVALPLIPWRIGRSEALRPRDAVVVVGFPLGRLHAVNLGKVVAVHDHDEERGWDHDDFVIDALLSQGNSGSPVLALSASTGEPELVGVYHAAYARGNALNVVVSIDQARALMERLEATAPAAVASLDGPRLARLVDLARSVPLPSFPFGAGSGLVHARSDGALVFEILPEDFPFRNVPRLVLADRRGCQAGLGTSGLQVWVGGRHGLVPVAWDALDGPSRRLVEQAASAMEADAAIALELRALEALGDEAAPRLAEQARLERQVRQLAARRRELQRATLELADRLGRAAAPGSVAVSSAVIGAPTEATCTSIRLEAAFRR